jgi:V8-like Glu-specific endopeptidase
VDFGDKDFVVHNEKTVRAFPNDCVGVIYFRTKQGQLGTGTGFLIAGDLVLTVAHNVYSRKLGQRYG